MIFLTFENSFNQLSVYFRLKTQQKGFYIFNKTTVESSNTKKQNSLLVAVMKREILTSSCEVAYT